MNDGEIGRIIEYLTAKGWTPDEIVKFLHYIATGKESI